MRETWVGGVRQALTIAGSRQVLGFSRGMGSWPKGAISRAAAQGRARRRERRSDHHSIQRSIDISTDVKVYLTCHAGKETRQIAASESVGHD